MENSAGAGNPPDAPRPHRSPQAWPCDDSALDISNLKQISTGAARCVGVWVTDAAGNPTLDFEQGQIACFYSEYELTKAIEVPIGGVLLRNDQNINVHGKTTLEYGTNVPTSVPAGTRLRFLQEIALEVATGVYTFDVGLTTMSSADYRARLSAPQTELNKAILILSLLMQAGRLTVSPRSTASPVRLLHHGIANLPGRCTVSLAESPAVVGNSASEWNRDIVAEPDNQSTVPAIFHITHCRAGSQWIRNILAACEPNRIVPPDQVTEPSLRRGIKAGRIYAAAYLTREEFLRLPRPTNSRHFLVLRDLRDTLVSGYFSVKVSHALHSQEMLRQRAVLNEIGSEEEGLLYMMDHWLPPVAKIQRSWLESGEPFIRYTDLICRDTEILERVLIGQCGLPTPPQRLRQAIDNYRFEKVTNGRQLGHEDVTSHARKGTPGDWLSHFSPRLKHVFKVRYGGLLIAAGYEKDASW